MGKKTKQVLVKESLSDEIIKQIDQIAKTCFQKGNNTFVVPSDSFWYFKNPFNLWCKYNAKEFADEEVDTYIEVLQEKGKDFEEEYVASQYPTIERERIYTRDWQGFKLLLQDMFGGVEIMQQAPLFYYPENTSGVADILERREGKSVLGDYYYVIREIKSTNVIYDAYKFQAFLYNFILGKIQGYTPDYVLFGFDGMHSVSVKYDEQFLFQTLKGMRELISSQTPPEAIYVKAESPWKAHCRKLAFEKKELTVIERVGVKVKEVLVSNNKHSWEVCASTTVIDFDRIGIREKTASIIIKSASALASQKLVPRVENIKIPKSDNMFFLDFEGFSTDASMNSSKDEIRYPFMLGVLASKNNSVLQFQLEGRSTREGKLFFRKVLNTLYNLAKEKKSIIFHWGPYEMELVKNMCKYIKYDPLKAKVIRKSFIDLCDFVVSNYYLPSGTANLKDLTSKLGFSFGSNKLGYIELMELYEDFLDKKTKRGILKIQKYNELDCLALAHVYKALTSEQK